MCVVHKTWLACMHAKESGNMLISNNSYHDEKVTEYMKIWAKHMHESRERGWSCTLQPHMLSSILSSALWHTSRDGLQPDDQPLLIIQIQNDSKWIDDWIIGWKSIGEHLQAGTLPSLQLQNIRLMSWIGKRPQWWTLTHDTSRNVHLSRGTSGPRPLQWTETMAAYHRLITPSSTTRANHTPHTRPHTILSILNYMVSPTSSQPLNIHIPLHHHINYPQPSRIHLFTIHSSLYSPQMPNPKLSVGL